MIRWLAVGIWCVAILFTSSLASTPEEGQPLLGYLKAKGGHVFVYAVLGWLLTETLRSPWAGLGLPARVAVPLAIVAGTIMASLDETRQLFVYSRTGQPSDVLLDTLSVSGGALLHYWLVRPVGGAALAAEHAHPPDDAGDDPPGEDQHQQVHRQDLPVAVHVRQEGHHDRQVQPDEQVQGQGAQRTGRR
jgi:VanZ family protein